MPGRKTRKDNPEPSRGRNSPGARNEHGPPAEAKMCSELGRNVEKSAEMTGSVHVLINAEYMCR